MFKFFRNSVENDSFRHLSISLQTCSLVAFLGIKKRFCRMWFYPQRSSETKPFSLRRTWMLSFALEQEKLCCRWTNLSGSRVTNTQALSERACRKSQAWWWTVYHMGLVCSNWWNLKSIEQHQMFVLFDVCLMELTEFQRSKLNNTKLVYTLFVYYNIFVLLHLADELLALKC